MNEDRPTLRRVEAPARLRLHGERELLGYGCLVCRRGETEAEALHVTAVGIGTSDFHATSRVQGQGEVDHGSPC